MLVILMSHIGSVGITIRCVPVDICHKQHLIITITIATADGKMVPELEMGGKAVLAVVKKMLVAELEVDGKVVVANGMVVANVVVEKAVAVVGKAVMAEVKANLMDSRLHRQVFYAALFSSEEVEKLHTQLGKEASYEVLPVCMKLERLEEELPEAIQRAKGKVRGTSIHIHDALKQVL